MSSLMSYRREVDKLSGLLKQTEDLVQDLHEELHMKDSLTVKEILANAHKSQDTHEDTIGKEEVDAFSSEQKFGQLAEGQQEDCDERAQEESMRKIEAELEAELATLELNMTSSTLDAQFSDLLEETRNGFTQWNGLVKKISSQLRLLPSWSIVQRQDR